MKGSRLRLLAAVCAAALSVCGCAAGTRVDGAVDRELETERFYAEESSQSQAQESQPGRDNAAVDHTAAGENDALNEFGLDAETMDILKYNIYVRLNNTIVEILDDIDNYFLVVDTAEEFRFRDDAEYSYCYRIKGFNMDTVEDAELVCYMEPVYGTLDKLVENMLPSMREIMETFDAIDASEYTYEENQYQQPRENHARLMACLDEFTAYAYEYLDQMDIMADEKSAEQEASMLKEGRLIIYNFSHMLTLASRILDEIYDQGIDDYNLTELDLTPVYPLFEELQATAAAYDEAVGDNNQLMRESLSVRQVCAGDWNSLLQAFEWMIKQVESGVPYEDPAHEYLGGLQHIYVVLSDRVEDYNGIFVE